VLNCVAAVLPGLKAYRRGHVVNITSDAGKKVFSGLAVYSATKFFVEAFAQGLRTELAPLGIKVTNVQPGDVKTELLSHTRDASALAEFGPPEVGAEMLEPEDVAEAVLFAMTQKARCAVNEILVEPTGCPL
jgi:NADP-dependent 3-hydroxy acid dehydrogenase YdfG